jgi:hypothetical protein
MRNTKTSEALRNLQAELVADCLSGGYLRIYSGAQPASPDAPTTGTLLAELRFGAFGAASGGVIEHGALTSDVAANANGVAGYCRAFGSDGTSWVDGTVGVADANLILSSVNITAGAIVSVSSFRHTVGDNG